MQGIDVQDSDPNSSWDSPILNASYYEARISSFPPDRNEAPKLTNWLARPAGGDKNRRGNSHWNSPA
ncbi:MAG: hypothetical protein EOP86_07450 [Verrucomicrobiaceae bacterium]|nr:MAG: hypothetical protein EOP86_07450 [Verrucomicrobiaceae bacterium]